MITDAIIEIFYQFARLIAYAVASFGDVGDNNAITNSIVAFKNYYMSLNAYMPLDTILAIASFVLAFEGVYFVYKLIRWGYRKVPGIT